MHRDPLVSTSVTSRAKRAHARELGARRKAPRASFPPPHDRRVDGARLILSMFTGELAAHVVPRLALNLVRALDQVHAAIGPEMAGRLHRGARGFVDAFYDTPKAPGEALYDDGPKAGIDALYDDGPDIFGNPFEAFDGDVPRPTRRPFA